MEYFAFGETFIEEHKNSHNSPYKFNGKELDEESGLYYYGARYYDPRISIWASVDPLMYDGTFLEGNHNEGFFNSYNHGSYTYCYQNPINLVDPNGKQTDPPNTIGIMAHARFSTYMKTISGSSGNWKSEMNFSEYSQRADLLYYGGAGNTSGKGAVWELKPISYRKEPKHSFAIAQLMGYVVSANQSKYNQELNFYPGSNGGPKPFEGTLTLKEGKYIFNYFILDPKEGLIYYTYSLNPDKQPPSTVPVTVKKPVEKPANDTGRRVVSLPRVPELSPGAKVAAFLGILASGAVYILDKVASRVCPIIIIDPGMVDPTLGQPQKETY